MCAVSKLSVNDNVVGTMVAPEGRRVCASRWCQEVVLQEIFLHLPLRRWGQEAYDPVYNVSNDFLTNYSKEKISHLTLYLQNKVGGHRDPLGEVK